MHYGARARLRRRAIEKEREKYARPGRGGKYFRARNAARVVSFPGDEVPRFRGNRA